MSKLIDNIATEMLRGRRAVNHAFKSYAAPKVDIKAEFASYEQLTRYRVGVNFGTTFYAKDAREKEHLERSFVAELTEIVYGDFRSRMRELEQAIFSQERSKIKSLLRDIFVEIS